MNYVPPPGNAVNFDDLNGPYTPPLGDAVNFNYVPVVVPPSYEPWRMFLQG